MKFRLIALTIVWFILIVTITDPLLTGDQKVDENYITLEWKSEKEYGEEVGVADIDNDGTKEIVVQSYKGYKTNYEPYTISVFNGITHELEWEYTNISGPYHNTKSLSLDDIDEDGRIEIITHTGNNIYVIDGKKRELEWKSEKRSDIQTLITGDVNDDGHKEIVIGTFDFDSKGASVGKVVIYDGSDYDIEYTIGYTDSHVNSVSIGDVDNDGVNEIVVGAWSIYVYDLTNNTKLKIKKSSENLIVVSDTDNDNNTEIIAIEQNLGNLIIYGVDYNSTLNRWNYIEELRIKNLTANCVEVDDIDYDGTQEIILGSIGRIKIYDGKNHILKGKINPHGSTKSLITCDIDNDGKKEIIASCDNYICVFEIMNLSKNEDTIEPKGNDNSFENNNEFIIATVAIFVALVAVLVTIAFKKNYK